MCRHGMVTPIMVSSAAPQALDEERLASGEDDTYYPGKDDEPGPFIPGRK